MNHKVIIDGKTIEAVSPEGQSARMEVSAFMQRARGACADSGDHRLPPGVCYVKSRGGVVVWVHETPPQIWNLRWIAPDSRKSYGGASYQNVVVSLPYIVLVAPFFVSEGRVELLMQNECFFRNAPLSHYPEDELFVPALLNCSLYAPPAGKEKIGVDGRPVVWVCTQHMPELGADARDPKRRMTTLFSAVYRTLLMMGFNYSSEKHEGHSGFTESITVLLEAAKKELGGLEPTGQPRNDVMSAWQAASAKNPDFALSVPWLKTGYTVKDVVERIYQHAGAAEAAVNGADDVARIVFNGLKPKRLRPRLAAMAADLEAELGVLL